MMFCLCCKSFSPTAPNKIRGLRIPMFLAVVILFCTVWMSKTLQILALCFYGDKNYAHQSHFHQYIIFGSSFMCIHVQEPLRTTTCALVCAHVEAIQAHYQIFPELHRPWIGCTTFVAEQNTGLSHQLMIWVSTDEPFWAKRSGLLFNSKNSHRCMLWTEPGPIKRQWL